MRSTRPKAALKRWIGQAFLRSAGWKMSGERPPIDRYVMIAAPHTSNWDMPFMLAMAFVYDIPVRWMGKHTLFSPPFGPFFERLGGIPIVRHRPGGVVGQMVEHFENNASLALMVPAEGTRSHVDYWKSGFYHIARAADVPVVLSYLDFGKKVGGIGPAIELTGDIAADMDKIRAFYAGMEGLHPKNVGVIRLREEDVEAVLEHDAIDQAEIERLASNL
ncbi:MAG TPA: lysophospholipid acyltransferase family protein [Polyangiales bacterium]|nr:lysophospholipid acyltransferase family protein [Polyangiales bacterium]